MRLKRKGEKSEMKIFIYIIFFGIFLVISVLIIALLIRSISFFVTSVRILKSKFTIKNNSVQSDEETTIIVEKSEQMDTIDI